MIFPIGDTNVEGGYRPIFSYAFIVLNLAIFVLQLSSPEHLICAYGTIPSSILGGQDLITLLTSMFLHAGWMHLIGNLLFLWVFADNIEAVVGNMRFLIFYITGGIFATLLHVFMDSFIGSGTIEECCLPCIDPSACKELVHACKGSVPSLGASGAISAVMGAYIILFPKSRIKVWFLLWTFTVPAFFFLGLWFLDQLISGVGSLGPISASTGGVAWWAHIGGFIFGIFYGVFHRDKIAKLQFKR